MKKKFKIKKIPIALYGYEIPEEELNPLSLNLSPEQIAYNQAIWNNNIPQENMYVPDLNPVEKNNIKEKPKSNVLNKIKNNLPNITLSTTPLIGAASGVINYVDSINTRKNEQERLAKQLRPIIGSEPINQGLDMPLYMKEGGQVKLTSQSDLDGYSDKDFDVPLEEANVVVEKDETVVMPDGGMIVVNGDKHYEPSGGEPRNYPEGSKVFSQKLKVDKNKIEEITGKKSKTKSSFSELVRKFNMEKENDILNNSKSEKISKTTAQINKELKLAKVEELFDHQETVNGNKLKALKEERKRLESELANPMINEEMLNEEIIMKNGGKVTSKVKIKNIPMAQKGYKIPPDRRGGYLGQGVPGDYKDGYTQAQIGEFNENLNNNLNSLSEILNIDPYTGDPNDVRARQLYNMKANELLGKYYYQNIAPPPNSMTRIGIEKGEDVNIFPYEVIADKHADNKPGVRTFGIQKLPFKNQEELDAWKNSMNIVDENNNIFADPSRLSEVNYQFIQPYLEQYFEEMERINPSSINPEYKNFNLPNTPYKLPLTPTKAVKDKTIKKKGNKDPRGDRRGNNSGVFEYLPEMIGAINMLDDYPIFASKMQPKYATNEVMNIQPALNRNFSQGQAMLRGSTGNAAIDNARASQVLANMSASDNEMFAQKFNFDTQNRQQVSNANIQMENQANQYNNQVAGQMADKMAMRKHNKILDINTIANSAYAKAKNLQKEKTSLRAASQMTPNYIINSDGTFTYLSPEQFISNGSNNNYNSIYYQAKMAEIQRLQRLENEEKKKQRAETKLESNKKGGLVRKK